MITTEISGYAEISATAHNDAAVADLSNDNRVLALAARLRSCGSIPILAKGLVQAYVVAFLAARGLDMVSVWTARPGEFLRVSTPDGRTWIRRYAVDAGSDVWEAMHRGEDISTWDVKISRQ